MKLGNREIGSEFWDVPVRNEAQSCFPSHTQWFLSGRSALQAVLNELGSARTAALPSWCCDSMIRPFANRGIEVRFYPVCVERTQTLTIETNCDILLIMDYFGYSGTSPEHPAFSGIVIRDVTHSLFSTTHSDADYSFGSLRKWCGVWTGGFAWAEDGHLLALPAADDCGYTALRAEAMRQKKRYIESEHVGGESGKGYLRIFSEAEEALEKVGISPAASRDLELIQRLDAERIRERRRKNASILMSAFSDVLLFPELREGDCPLFVPILVPDGQRDRLRQYLIKNQIYCPVHWPLSRYHAPCGETETIYRNELSLVCDQRYTEEDMQRIVETIKNFWKAGYRC